MEPVSTVLTGLALVKQSVDFVKSNIATVQDIGQIAGVINNALDGEKQIQKSRFNDKSIIGQSRDAANAVIDAKLAQENLEELKILVDNRFGYGTWREIVETRARMIREEKEAEQRAKYLKDKARKETMDMIFKGITILAIVAAIVLAAGVGIAIYMAV